MGSGLTLARPQLSVVVPMHNEAEGAAEFLSALDTYLTTLGITYEVLAIDDGSTDHTWEVLAAAALRQPALRRLRLSRNFGKDIALAAGLGFAEGDAVIPMDADFQHPPAVIGDLLAKWREGYDMVYAVRRTRDTDDIWRRLSSSLFYRIFDHLCETTLPPGAGDFRLLDRRVVEVLRTMPERDRFMKGMFAWVGFRHTGVEFDPPPRRSGRTSWSFRRLLAYAFDGLTAFSHFPLTISTWIGAAIAIPSLLLGAYYLIRTLVFGVDVPGYASIIVAVLSLGGLQLLILGLMGSYLGRVFDEVKQRPLFIVSETCGWPEPPMADTDTPLSGVRHFGGGVVAPNPIHNRPRDGPDQPPPNRVPGGNGQSDETADGDIGQG